MTVPAGLSAQSQRFEAIDMRSKFGLARMISRERAGERRDTITDLEGEVRRGGSHHLRQRSLVRNRVDVFANRHG